MKKYFILFSIIVFTGIIGISLYSLDKEISGKNINDFLIVETKFKGKSRIVTDEFIPVKLYKDNKEIEGVTLFFNTVFRIDEGTYELSADYDDQHVSKVIYKSSDKKYLIPLEFEANQQLKNLEIFDRITIFVVLLINILFFLILVKKNCKVSLLLILTFLSLLAVNLLSFVNLFTPNQLFILQLILQINLTILFAVCFLKLINLERKIFVKIITIIFVFLFIMGINMLIYIKSEALSYFIKYHPKIFYINAIAMYILAFILDYIVLIAPIILVLIELKKSDNQDFKKIKIFQMLILFLFLFIEIFTEFFETPLYTLGDVLNNIQVSSFFWILFFSLNIEYIVKSYKKFQKYLFYSLKYLVLIELLYIFIIKTHKYEFILPIAAVCILGDVIFLTTEKIFKKISPKYDDLFLKLKGTDNIDDFEKIIEKELPKRITAEKIKFKIFLSANEHDEYIKNKNDDIITNSEGFQDNYKEYNLGIKLKINTNTCIALLLVKYKDKMYFNEDNIFLMGILEKLFYTINYIRTLTLKKNLVSDTKVEYSNEIKKEALQFISEFATLTYNHTEDEKIKTYSKAIIEKAKIFGDSND